MSALRIAADLHLLFGVDGGKLRLRRFARAEDPWPRFERRILIANRALASCWVSRRRKIGLVLLQLLGFRTVFLRGLRLQLVRDSAGGSVILRHDTALIGLKIRIGGLRRLLRPAADAPLICCAARAPADPETPAAESAAATACCSRAAIIPLLLGEYLIGAVLGRTQFAIQRRGLRRDFLRAPSGTCGALDRRDIAAMASSICDSCE